MLIYKYRPRLIDLFKAFEWSGRGVDLISATIHMLAYVRSTVDMGFLNATHVDRDLQVADLLGLGLLSYPSVST